MLLNRRPAVVLAVFAASVLAVTPPVSAGCLCDWLFGRPPVYAAAYPPAYAAAMPVAPVAAPVQVNYAPVQANYAPVQANYAPVQASYAPTVTSQLPATSYAAQMPAYGSTAPLPTGYAGQYSSLYGNAPAAPIAPAPVTSFYGSGNIYPPTNVTTSYSAASPAVAAPVAAAPVVAVPGRRGLLGWLFGHNYHTSYYAAPVTYYRPQTTVDPTSGSTVTVQRPCTSYQYQVQRAPYYGLQPATATPAAIAPTSCGVNGQPSYAQPAPTYAQPNQTYAPAPQYNQPATNGAPLSNGTPAEGFVPQPTLPPAGTQSSGMQATPPTYYSYPSSSSAPLTGAPLTGAPPSTTQSYSPATPSNPWRNGAAEEQGNDASSNNGSGNDTSSSNNETSLNSAWPSSESPSSYARPIPAPPATWNQTAPATTPAPAPSNRYESSGGRTAALPAWGYKKISWSQPVEETIQRATYSAPAQVAPSPRNSEPARRAAAAARPRAYDDSGWRSAP